MIGSIINVVGSVIDKIFPNKAEADAAKLKLLEMEQSGELAKLDKQSSVIISEASSQSALARNWRPTLMYIFMAIIGNNYLLCPWLQSLGFHAISLPIPDRMWSLIELSIGGYIGGRSMEKIVDVIKSNR